MKERKRLTRIQLHIANMHTRISATWNVKVSSLETGIQFDELLKLHFTRQNGEIPLANNMYTGFLYIVNTSAQLHE